MLCSRALAFALIATTAASPAIADDDPTAAPEVSASRRAAAIAAAIFPGVLVRGAGSWIIGEHRTARRLAATGAVGLAGMVAGGAPIAATGSSPYTIWTGVPLLVGGTGLVMSSWLADLWVAAGGNRLAAAPRALPPWSVDVATTWQHDAYRERALLGAAGHLELGPLGLDAGGYLDAGGASRAAETGARWRLIGPRTEERRVGEGGRTRAW